MINMNSNKTSNLNFSSNLTPNLTETSVISTEELEYADFTTSNNGL